MVYEALNPGVLAAAGDPAAGVGVFAATAAGFVSFLSPCVLPLVPGYLSAVAGVAPADMAGAQRRRLAVPSLLFVASFSVIFVLEGLAATGIGSGLQTSKPTLEKIAGSLIIAMGVFFLLAPLVPRLNREWHPGKLMTRAGRGGPVVAGAAFAIAWTPCIGPTLSAILGAAALSRSAGHGAILLAFYSAGLAIPFLATALAFERLTGAFALVKRHYRVVIAVGGVILIAMGILVLTGELYQLNIEAQKGLKSIGLDFLAGI